MTQFASPTTTAWPSDKAGMPRLRSFGLRWLALYLLFYIPSGVPLWGPLIVWVGHNVLGVQGVIPVAQTGSGDRLFDYIQVAFLIVATGIGAAVWILFDRTNKHDAAVYEVLRVVVRYYLAFTMFNYGFSKVFHEQMPGPGEYRLSERYGDSSPMGLLWTFMGYSAGYSFFAGAAEVVGGALVLFRRTTTLGALVIAAIMLNIELLNLNYDVPVKLYAAHLLLMALVLLAPDLKRLTDFFLLNRPTQPVDLRRAWPKGWMGRAALAVKVVVIIVLVSSTISGPIIMGSKIQPYVDKSQYLLLTRGFHWISEVPYNR